MHSLAGRSVLWAMVCEPNKIGCSATPDVLVIPIDKMSTFAICSDGERRDWRSGIRYFCVTTMAIIEVLPSTTRDAATTWSPGLISRNVMGAPLVTLADAGTTIRCWPSL